MCATNATTYCNFCEGPTHKLDQELWFYVALLDLVTLEKVISYTLKKCSHRKQDPKASRED